MLSGPLYSAVKQIAQSNDHLHHDKLSGTSQKVILRAILGQKKVNALYCL